MNTRKPPGLRRRLGLGLLGLLTVIVLAVTLLALVPPHTGDLASHPNPAADYAEATRRVATLQAQEAARYNPLCKTMGWTTSSRLKWRPTGARTAAR